MVGYIVDHYCYRFIRGRIRIVVVGYIVDHYCYRFIRGRFVLLWLVILSIITARGLAEEGFRFFVVGYIVDHYC